MSHWSETIAQKIIARRPDKEEYVCAAGISPSGSIHIGNFRDLATSYFVVRALRKLGKKARKMGFDFDDAEEAMQKVYEEVNEVSEALKTKDQAQIEEEQEGGRFRHN